MRKEIKKDGNSYKIRINSEDIKLYGLKEGDIIEMEILKKIELKKND